VGAFQKLSVESRKLTRLRSKSFVAAREDEIKTISPTVIDRRYK